MADRARKARKKESAPEASPQVKSPRPAEEASAPILPVTPLARRALLAILVLALALRAYNLLGMFPILVDESIYLRWAEIIQHQGNWFVSLLDGKPPLTYWFLALPRFVSDGDPLAWARALSILAGLASTVGIYAVGARLAGGKASESAGLIAAGFYAIFPWALLYDRLAYTEAWVNLLGVTITLTALVCFERNGSGAKTELWPGLALGLGFFTKQTLILWAGVPAVAAFLLGRKHPRNWILRLATVYVIAALFLGANFALTPEAPTLESHDAVLHHTGFFADPADLVKDPLLAARKNFPLIFSYIGAYLTWPLALCGLLAAGWLWPRRPMAAGLLLAGSILPVTAEVFLLDLMFPTRYPFAHFWPFLAVAAAGIAVLYEDKRTDWADRTTLLAVAAALVLAGPMIYRDARMLFTPREGLHRADVQGFLSDSAHVGFGIEPAIEFLRYEAQANGPFTLLTDPIWGPPSDAVFPYLNQRHGIRVYEAWWTQLSPTHEILPGGSAEVLRSHYERISAGKVDFRSVGRVFYLTDTNYYPREAVLTRQPNARHVAAFPKPGGKHAIEIYRLQ